MDFPEQSSSFTVRTREIVAVLFGAFAVFVFVSIASFSPDDPSSRRAGTGLVATNLFGSWGAQTADHVLLVLGWPAYLIPVGLAWLAVLVLRGGVLERLSWPRAAAGLGGYLLLLASTSLLARLHLVATLPAPGEGGVVGEALASTGLPLLHWQGLTLFAVAAWAIGVQLVVGHSWLAIAEAIGRALPMVGRGVLIGVKSLRHAVAWASNFALRREQASELGAIDPAVIEDMGDEPAIGVLVDRARAEPTVALPPTRAVGVLARQEPAGDEPQSDDQPLIESLPTETGASVDPAVAADRPQRRDHAPVATADDDFEESVSGSDDAGQGRHRIPDARGVSASLPHALADFRQDVEPATGRGQSRIEPIVKPALPRVTESAEAVAKTEWPASPQPTEPAVESAFSDAAEVVDPAPNPEWVASAQPAGPFAEAVLASATESVEPVANPEWAASAQPAEPLAEPALASATEGVEPVAATEWAASPQPVEPVAEPALAPVVPLAAAPATEAEPQPPDQPAVKKPSRELPDLDLLEEGTGNGGGGYSEEFLESLARQLEARLKDFRVDAEVVSVQPGPVVTCLELQPAAGVKVSKISGLAKDLARSLAVVSVRIVEVIPGKSVVGIEIPNEQRETVRLKEILSSDEYQDAESPLTIAVGKDIGGAPVMADIGKMPHLLVAGTTGSGKSVGVNAMLLSLLYKATPEQLRLILVDPKMLELSVYDGIPHLLTPVVTDMNDAGQALNWCVAEMERRYRLMAALGVRNLAGYNKRVDDAAARGKPLEDPLWPTNAEGDPDPLSRLPFIVVVIDEFADMMMVVGKKVEQLIARIAQKARAAGIHLVLATQRPSVDVITGLIKANIPSRMSFQVSSRIDSRTILDQGGAEHLLGHGDMLYLPPGTGTPTRVHGAFVSDEEVHAVAADWKERGEPDYVPDVVSGTVDLGVPGTVDLAPEGSRTESEEPLYDEAVAFVLESRRASISAVQRKLRIGYNRAARLIEAMEEAGIVTPMNSNGSREVLPPASAA